MLGINCFVIGWLESSSCSQDILKCIKPKGGEATIFELVPHKIVFYRSGVVWDFGEL